MKGERSRVIVGRRAVIEALRSDTKVRRIYSSSRREFEELQQLAAARRLQVQQVPRRKLDELSEGVRHQDVAAIVDEYSYATLEDLIQLTSPNGLLVALDEITDPQNFGAIVRSAVALGAAGLLIQKHRAVGVTAASTRASAGATEHAHIARVTNMQKTLQDLSQAGFLIVGMDAGTGKALRTFDPGATPVALVVGSEGKGLRRMVRERCDVMVEIPLSDAVASLNASVAAAIGIHHFCGSGSQSEPTDDQQ